MIFQRVALLVLSAGVAVAFVPPSPSTLMLRQHVDQNQRERHQGIVLALLSDDNEIEHSYLQEDSGISNNVANYANDDNKGTFMAKQAAAFLTMTVLATSSLPPLSYAAAASVQAPKVETKTVKKVTTPAPTPAKKVEPAIPAEKRAVLDAKMGLDLAQKSLASTTKTVAATTADDKAVSVAVAAEAKVTDAKKALIQNNDKLTSLKAAPTTNPALINSAALKVADSKEALKSAEAALKSARDARSKTART
ncbi:hypothetical protein MHU86_16915 [Fragilaria crotonensis]|nr:hypothetical protein MHU86_16915 [Fragilaria crotonensis]